MSGSGSGLAGGLGHTSFSNNNTNASSSTSGSYSMAGSVGTNTSSFGMGGQLTSVSDLPQASASSNTEIQKFAEQSRSHGKMIEYFIENHLPPLMKTERLIKELGKMDFDTFQQAPTNDSNYGFDFDHLRFSSLTLGTNRNLGNVSNNNNNNNNNNNGMNIDNNEAPPLEKDPNSNNLNLNSQTELYRQQIERLERENKQLRDEKEKWLLERMQFETTEKSLRKELKRWKQVANEYRPMINGIRQFAIEGMEPHYERVKFIKNENFAGFGDNNENELNNPNTFKLPQHKCTEAVEELRQDIIKRKNIDLENWNIEADKEFNPFLDNILTYLMDNDENNFEPTLKLSPQEDAEGLEQSHVVEKFFIKEHERIGALNGTFGLRARCDLAANTVIGQYCGVEYLGREFEDVFSNTRICEKKNIYAFNLDVIIPKWNKKTGNEEDGNDIEMISNDKRNDKYSKFKEGETHRVVIDAYNSENERTLLTYVNDCRKNIRGEIKTEDDSKFENVKFVKVYVNGWPMIFVVTCKKVNKNEELLAYYGKDFGLAMMEFDRNEKNRNDIARVIDNNILQGKVSTNDNFDLTHTS